MENGSRKRCALRATARRYQGVVRHGTPFSLPLTHTHESRKAVYVSQPVLSDNYSYSEGF
jgi:hypothetical protein